MELSGDIARYLAEVRSARRQAVLDDLLKMNAALTEADTIESDLQARADSMVKLKGTATLVEEAASYVNESNYRVSGHQMNFRKKFYDHGYEIPLLSDGRVEQTISLLDLEVPSEHLPSREIVVHPEKTREVKLPEFYIEEKTKRLNQELQVPLFEVENDTTQQEFGVYEPHRRLFFSQT